MKRMIKVMKVQEVTEKCNSENIWSFWEFEEAFPELKRVASDLNIDRHRWFEISTNVYECDDGFVGVEGVSEVYSEMMDYRDCDCPCTATEYEAVQTITYKHKTTNG